LNTIKISIESKLKGLKGKHTKSYKILPAPFRSKFERNSYIDPQNTNVAPHVNYEEKYSSAKKMNDKVVKKIHVVLDGNENIITKDD
jgi:hypothetical protein